MNLTAYPSSHPAAAGPSSTSETLLLIPAKDVLHLLDRDATLAVVRDAFVHHSAGAGRVFPLIREPVGHNAVFGIKAGDIAAEGVLGFKAAGFWPDNVAKSKGAHQATIMLFDPATGRPICLLDGNHVTTLRTGAAGAIGIQMFARADSRSLCLFGTGVQAQIHLEYALQVLPGLNTVTYLTASSEPDTAFEAANAGRCRIRHDVDANRAVSQADLVITATPSRQPLFANDAVQAGTHINAVGADTAGKRELPEGLLTRAQVFVDDARQAAMVGESQWVAGGALTEIGAVMQANTPFTRAAQAITVFDMTGLALQDLVVAQMLFDSARASGRGMAITWPW